jgi:hypothetical protein
VVAVEGEAGGAEEERWAGGRVGSRFQRKNIDVASTNRVTKPTSIPSTGITTLR